MQPVNSNNTFACFVNQYIARTSLVVNRWRVNNISITPEYFMLNLLFRWAL